MTVWRNWSGMLATLMSTYFLKEERFKRLPLNFLDEFYSRAAEVRIMCDWCYTRGKDCKGQIQYTELNHIVIWEAIFSRTVKETSCVGAHLILMLNTHWGSFLRYGPGVGCSKSVLFIKWWISLECQTIICIHWRTKLKYFELKRTLMLQLDGSYIKKALR